jgi:hypothetical protein
MKLVHFTPVETVKSSCFLFYFLMTMPEEAIVVKVFSANDAVDDQPTWDDLGCGFLKIVEVMHQSFIN